MRSIDLSLPFNRLARMLTSVSVRTRIVVLALIPVAGFLANGLTYASGEGDVGRRLPDRHAIHCARRRQPRFQKRGRGDAHCRQGLQRQPQQQLVIIFDESQGWRLEGARQHFEAIDQHAQ